MKRPGYYAAFYVGRPVTSRFYLYGADRGLDPIAENGEDRPVDLYKSVLKGKRGKRPMNNGGITLFQTPGFGNAILGGPTAFTHHGLVAIGADAKRHVEDYFETSYQLQTEEGSLTTRGPMDALPLRYERRYTFHADAIEVTSDLKATEAFVVERVVENIPLVGGVFKLKGANISVYGVEAVIEREDPAIRQTEARSSLLLLNDQNGHGVRLVFTKPQSLRICRSGPISEGGIQHNRVEVELPAEWSAGERFRLRYFLQVAGGNRWPPSLSPSLLIFLRIRVRCEHVFGRMSQMAMDRLRTIGLLRAEQHNGLCNLVYNTDRYAFLCR